MRGLFIHIKIDGTVNITECLKKPTLNEVQVAVGGYVELIAMYWNGEPAQMYVNEEGRLKDLPVNEVATKVLWLAKGHLYPPVVGDVVILAGKAMWKTVRG